jgi:hypothetical protein
MRRDILKDEICNSKQMSVLHKNANVLFCIVDVLVSNVYEILVVIHVHIGRLLCCRMSGLCSLHQRLLLS